jgi:hypothetical protein
MNVLTVPAAPAASGEDRSSPSPSPSGELPEGGLLGLGPEAPAAAAGGCPELEAPGTLAAAVPAAVSSRGAVSVAPSRGPGVAVAAVVTWMQTVRQGQQHIGNTNLSVLD